MCGCFLHTLRLQIMCVCTFLNAIFSALSIKTYSNVNNLLFVCLLTIQMEQWPKWKIQNWKVHESITSWLFHWYYIVYSWNEKENSFSLMLVFLFKYRLLLLPFITHSLCLDLGLSRKRVHPPFHSKSLFILSLSLYICQSLIWT